MLTNILARHPLLFSRPDKYSVIHKDFHTDEELTEFVVTTDGSGAAGTSVVDTTGSSHFGRFVISGQATTDKTGSQLQYDAESMALVASKETMFWGDMKMSEATQSCFAAGLMVTDGTILDTSTGAITITDGVLFRKTDGATTIDCVIVRDSVEVAVQSAVKTLANATQYHLEIIVVMGTNAGEGTAYFYINDDQVAILHTGTMPYSAEESLTMSHAFLSGSATGTMTDEGDYLGSAMTR
jgi:hypothetical protein